MSADWDLPPDRRLFCPIGVCGHAGCDRRVRAWCWGDAPGGACGWAARATV